jgi:hypothetical protein
MPWSFEGVPVDMGHGRFGCLDDGGRCRDARDVTEKREGLHWVAQERVSVFPLKMLLFGIIFTVSVRSTTVMETS